MDRNVVNIFKLEAGRRRGRSSAQELFSDHNPPPLPAPRGRALSVLLNGSLRHWCIQKPSGFGSGVKSYVPPSRGEKENTLPYPELPGKPLCYFGLGGLFGNKIGKEQQYLELCALSGVNVNRRKHIYGFISQRGSQTEGNLRRLSVIFSRAWDKSGGNHLTLWGL